MISDPTSALDPLDDLNKALNRLIREQQTIRQGNISQSDRRSLRTQENKHVSDSVQNVAERAFTLAGRGDIIQIELRGE